MESHWYFKPKYGEDLISKVMNCFADGYLGWGDSGHCWNIERMADHYDGWLHMYVYPDGNTDYYTETCFHDEPISGRELTEHMLVLLTGENGCAHEHDSEDPENNDWNLEEVDISDVLRCLSAKGTHIYSPCGAKLWMCSVDTGNVKLADMFDFILTQKVA